MKEREKDHFPFASLHKKRTGSQLRTFDRDEAVGDVAGAAVRGVGGRRVHPLGGGRRHDGGGGGQQAGEQDRSRRGG